MPSIEQPVVRLVFANGRLVRRDGSAPAGLRVLPWEEALATCPELVGKHFMAYETPLGSEKFAALHLAHLRSGVFVHAAAGTEVAAPVEVVHCFSGTQALYVPHTLVVADTSPALGSTDTYSPPREATWAGCRPASVSGSLRPAGSSRGHRS